MDSTQTLGEGEAHTEETTPKRNPRKTLMFVIKVVFSLAMLAYVYSKVLNRDGAKELLTRLSDLHWGWIVAAIVMQLTAICFAALRWRTLLGGQGIRPSWRFLAGSIMIARFWGAFTPGGFTGFGGWRIFDVAQHTKKTARATATITVEMLLGKVAFGVVVMSASIFGVRFVGTDGVLLINVIFLGIVATALLFVSRPRLFLFVTKWLPSAVRTRVQTLVDALLQYEGKTKLLIIALFCGMGVHAFNNLIYVCAARALDVELGVGEVFFASSIQILATLMPASINGLGLREATAVALYTSPAVGLPLAVAVLIPTVGFACEMFVSAFGGLVFLARRSGYEPNILVEDPDRENVAHQQIEVVSEENQPKPLRGLMIGATAGLLGGAIVGLCEALVVVQGGQGTTGLSVLAYGTIAYGVFCAIGGAVFGWLLAFSGRKMKRAAVSEPKAYAQITALVVSAFALVIGAFRIRRDYFHEELVWKSGKGLMVFLGCALVCGVLFLVLSRVLTFIVRRHRVMVGAWGSPAVVAATVLGLCGVAMFIGRPAEASKGGATGATSKNSVLFIVVDTLRADHLPAYGYDKGKTPNLDAFAEDSIRFSQAFSNASWTRPSFASMLTGRYPSSHGVMSKSSVLPDELTTLPESYKAAGYETGGFVTNFNVSSYRGFHQGFDEYTFLEPEFVLGADEAASKLLLMQVLRQTREKVYAKLEIAKPGMAYQDAETVNTHVAQWLDKSKNPFFLFVGYMDPHDPYFNHPYDNAGYARAAHQHPDPEEAETLRGLYNGEITYWDSHFGKLIADLKKRGLYDDLTIVVTSDHGEEFNEHGGFWHGTTLYDEQVHVPLFVKLPGNKRGGIPVNHWVQSIDLMPTLLTEAGIEIPKGVQGRSLFEGSDRVYAEESHEGNVLESVRELRGTQEWKLITANKGNKRGLKPAELYRVDDDPGEQSDLSEDESETRRMVTTLTKAAQTAREGAVEAKSVAIDADEAARLKAIGYMGDE